MPAASLSVTASGVRSSSCLRARKYVARAAEKQALCSAGILAM